MIVSKSKFQEIMSDFDEFMAENGYVKPEALAKKFCVSPVTVRAWSMRGKLQDTIYIGDRQYVKNIDEYPDDQRKGHSGRRKEGEE